MNCAPAAKYSSPKFKCAVICALNFLFIIFFAYQRSSYLSLRIYFNVRAPANAAKRVLSSRLLLILLCSAMVKIKLYLTQRLMFTSLSTDFQAPFLSVITPEESQVQGRGSACVQFYRNRCVIGDSGNQTHEHPQQPMREPYKGHDCGKFYKNKTNQTYLRVRTSSTYFT